MCSTHFTNFLENQQAQKVPNKKTQIRNKEKMKAQYLTKKEFKTRITADMEKIIKPIEQEILALVIKLSGRKYYHKLVGIYDNKKYHITISMNKCGR